MQVDLSQLLFRGLRVRMSCVTGVASECKQNDITRTREYVGQLPDLAKALSSCPHGGQIVIGTQLVAELHAAGGTRGCPARSLAELLRSRDGACEHPGASPAHTWQGCAED